MDAFAPIIFRNWVFGMERLHEKIMFSRHWNTILFGVDSYLLLGVGLAIALCAFEDSQLTHISKTYKRRWHYLGLEIDISLRKF